MCRRLPSQPAHYAWVRTVAIDTSLTIYNKILNIINFWMIIVHPCMHCTLKSTLKVFCMYDKSLAMGCINIVRDKSLSNWSCLNCLSCGQQQPLTMILVIAALYSLSAQSTNTSELVTRGISLCYKKHWQRETVMNKKWKIGSKQ